MNFRLRFRRILELVLNVSSLVVITVTLLSLIALNSLDFFLWLSLNITTYNILYYLSLGGSVTILVLGSGLIMSARRIAKTTGFLDIPKPYVPINVQDLPKPVYELVQSELTRIASVRSNCKPLDSEFPVDVVGVGRPAGLLDGLRFREAALDTLDALEQDMASISDHLKRDVRMTARGYIRHLTAQCMLQEEVAQFYIDEYESIRFGALEVTEMRYIDFMKIYTVLTKT